MTTHRCLCGKALYDDAAYCVPCGDHINAVYDRAYRLGHEDGFAQGSRAASDAVNEFVNAMAARAKEATP